MSLPKLLTQEEAEALTECQKCNVSLAGYRSWSCQESNGKLQYFDIWCFKCAEKERHRNWRETKVLTSRIILDAYYLKDPELTASLERVYRKMHEFEERVWFGGMQQTVVASVSSGMSFRLKDFEILSTCSAGRCLVQIENKEGQRVTLITEEKSEERRMGLQGICAKEEEAIALLDMAMRLHEKGATLKDDKKVGLG